MSRRLTLALCFGLVVALALTSASESGAAATALAVPWMAGETWVVSGDYGVKGSRYYPADHGGLGYPNQLYGLDFIPADGSSAEGRAILLPANATFAWPTQRDDDAWKRGCVGFYLQGTYYNLTICHLDPRTIRTSASQAGEVVGCIGSSDLVANSTPHLHINIDQRPPGAAKDAWSPVPFSGEFKLGDTDLRPGDDHYRLPIRSRTQMRGDDPCRASSPDVYAARYDPVRLGEMASGTAVQLQVGITNMSTTTWRAGTGAGSVRLAYHWRGPVSVWDGIRADLPRDLEPNASATLSLPVIARDTDHGGAPLPTGQYVLILDAVHEGVAWFSDRGVFVYQLNVTVTAGPQPGPAPSASPTTSIYSARYEPSSLRQVTSGSTAQLAVGLTNTSAASWRAGSGGGAVRLAYHWRGPVSVWDGARADLPKELPPGASATLSVPISAADTDHGGAPLPPGQYILIIDAVHEGYAWFSDRGVFVYQQTVVVASPPTGVADGAQYLSEAAPYDNASVAAGSTFTKCWTLRNTGTSTWDATFSATRIDGSYGPTTLALPTIPPGSSTTLCAAFVAPASAGTHRATYRLHGPRSHFGDSFWVQVVVSSATPTPTPLSTPTPSAVSDGAQYLDELAPFDGATVAAGSTFTKCWRFRNTGTSTWDGSFWAVRIDGSYGPSTIALSTTVSAGSSTSICGSFQAPSAAGAHTATYRLQGARGQFGDIFWVRVTVIAATPTPAIAWDSALYVSETSPYDGGSVAAGSAFTKCWTLKNTGTSTWDGAFSASRTDGSYGPATLSLSGTVAPGATTTICGAFQAPGFTGTHRVTYRLQGPRGQFGEGFWVQVVVLAAPPVPTATLSPTPVSDSVQYVSETSPYDGASVAAGSAFTKCWTLRNTGSSTWDSGSFSALRTSGSYGSSALSLSGSVAVGTSANVCGSFQAPTMAGTHRATYRLLGPRGQFGDTFWVQVVVAAATPTPTAAPTPTSTPTPAPTPSTTVTASLVAYEPRGCLSGPCGSLTISVQWSGIGAPGADDSIFLQETWPNGPAFFDAPCVPVVCWTRLHTGTPQASGTRTWTVNYDLTPGRPSYFRVRLYRPGQKDVYSAQFTVEGRSCTTIGPC